jgi:hypothetical protein
MLLTRNVPRSPFLEPRGKAAGRWGSSRSARLDSSRRSRRAFRAGTKPQGMPIDHYYSPTSSKAMYPCQSFILSLVLAASFVNGAPLTRQRLSGAQSVATGSAHSKDFISGDDMWRSNLLPGPIFTGLSNTKTTQALPNTIKSERCGFPAYYRTQLTDRQYQMGIQNDINTKRHPT